MGTQILKKDKDDKTVKTVLIIGKAAKTVYTDLAAFFIELEMVCENYRFEGSLEILSSSIFRINNSPPSDWI